MNMQNKVLPSSSQQPLMYLKAALFFRLTPVLLVFSLVMFLTSMSIGAPAAASGQELHPWAQLGLHHHLLALWLCKGCSASWEPHSLQGSSLLSSILQILVVNQVARPFDRGEIFHTNQKTPAAHFSQSRFLGHTANEVGFRKQAG